ncbi:hypothetical protein OS12_49100 [Dickeya oryzae]
MTNNRLEWQQLLPDHTPYQTLFSQAAQLAPAEFSAVQPRLADALTIFLPSPLAIAVYVAEGAGK